MGIVYDRLKAAIFSLVRAATARVAYAAPRFARVVKATTAADGSTTLDVAPDDPTFPTMAGVPLFHGVPGLSITLKSGTHVLVEHSEADPAKPFVRSWAGGESVSSATWTAETLNLGGPNGDFAAKATPIGTYFAAIASHTHPETGSVTGPSATLANPPGVAATSAKVK